MGGVNPYIKPPDATLPQQKYKIVFLPQHVTVEVDPAKIPYGRTGQPGSILDIALENGVDIDHACGGVCACSTCHVIVKEGLESCSPMTDAEGDMLDMAPATTPNSRLACQCVPNGTKNLVVEVPSWNRNLVREGS